MLLLGSYGTAAVLAFTQPHIFNTPIMAGGHLALASALVVHVRALCPAFPLPPCLLTTLVPLPRRWGWSAPSTTRTPSRASTASSGRSSTASTCYSCSSRKRDSGEE